KQVWDCHGAGRGLAARGAMFSQTGAAASGFCAGHNLAAI
ncbi:hypothetical protein A2U01_0034489, partial [Trifolium medium]|nr:hypothetical protein [Trifolium medium]